MKANDKKKQKRRNIIHLVLASVFILVGFTSLGVGLLQKSPFAIICGGFCLIMNYFAIVDILDDMEN